MTHDTAGRTDTNPTPKTKLLLVDDDPLIVESLGLVLDDEYETHSTATRAGAKSLLSSLCPVPALALVDLGLPPTPHSPEEGFTLIGELLAFDPGMKILVLSGQSSRVDFIPKPTDALVLKDRLAHQSAMVAAERQARASSEGGTLLGTSPAIETLRALVRQFADVPFPVLVVGEPRVGKELVAHRLHAESQRAHQPFLSVNSELESEVFAPIDTEALSSDQVAERQIETPGFRLDETLAAGERRYINAALKLGHGNLSQAARLLGVNRSTLYSKIERLADSRV